MQHNRRVGSRLTVVGLLMVAVGVASAGRAEGSAPPSYRLNIDLTSDEFTILEVDESGLIGSPDGHVTFIREGGVVRFWAPLAGGKTVELLTTDIVDLHAASDPPVIVLGPSGGSNLDSEYAGGSKVLRLSGGRLAMLYQGENHACGGDRAEVTIALATSDDDGATWQRQGAIITAPPWTFASCADAMFYGAGSFSAVVSPDRQYLYVYFNQWLPDESGVTRVARSLISSGLGPGTWSKYYQGGWTQPGLGGRADDVLPVPATERDLLERSVAIPTVSWNTTYHMWLAVYVTITGFWYSSSADGLHWNPAEQLFGGVVLFAPESLVDHQQYIYYPSLVDPLADEDGRTSETGILLYAQGGWTAAHHMVARTVDISREELPPLPATGSSRWPLVLAACFVTVGLLLRRSATTPARR